MRSIATIILLLLGSKLAHPAETVMASTYGDPQDIKRSGEKLTSTGKLLDPNGNYVAHRYLPIGSRITLSHGSRKIAVEVNDFGPFVRGRAIDLNPHVNEYLQCGGLCRIKVEPWPPLPRSRPEVLEYTFAWGVE